MKTNSRCATQSVIVILFVLFASLILFAGQTMAQGGADTQAKSDAKLEDALFLCLASKLGYKYNEIGDLRSVMDHTQANDL